MEKGVYQPFCFAESIDIKLEEMFSLCANCISLHIQLELFVIEVISL